MGKDFNTHRKGWLHSNHAAPQSWCPKTSSQNRNRANNTTATACRGIQIPLSHQHQILHRWSYLERIQIHMSEKEPFRTKFRLWNTEPKIKPIKASLTLEHCIREYFTPAFFKKSSLSGPWQQLIHFLSTFLNMFDLLEGGCILVISRY